MSPATVAVIAKRMLPKHPPLFEDKPAHSSPIALRPVSSFIRFCSFQNSTKDISSYADTSFPYCKLIHCFCLVLTSQKYISSISVTMCFFLCQNWMLIPKQLQQWDHRAKHPFLFLLRVNQNDCSLWYHRNAMLPLLLSENYVCCTQCFQHVF